MIARLFPLFFWFALALGGHSAVAIPKARIVTLFLELALFGALIEVAQSAQASANSPADLTGSLISPLLALC